MSVGAWAATTEDAASPVPLSATVTYFLSWSYCTFDVDATP
jgi:hypothetical protein